MNEETEEVRERGLKKESSREDVKGQGKEEVSEMKRQRR